MRPFVALILITACLGLGWKHEFYVSITEMNLSNDTIQVAIKLFTHDFEEVLKESEGSAVFLDQSSDPEKAFRVIRDYCAARFEISGAGKPYRLKWIGHEYVEDVTWVYAFAIINPASQLLFVKNDLLSSRFHDQHNMIHFKNGDYSHSTICTRSKPEARFSLTEEDD